MVFLAWTPIQGRSSEIAAALGGEAYCLFDRRMTNRFLVPIRYIFSAVKTLRFLWQRHPQGIIATNPPILVGLVAWMHGVRNRVPVVLDSHPGGFGAQGDAVSGRLQIVHRWLARRVQANMVTDQHWIDVLDAWGARGIIVHEAPPQWAVQPAGPIIDRPIVLFAGTFGGDEPIEIVFDAARSCSNADFWITGDPRRCPPTLLESVPSNVTLTGFLDTPAYARAMERANIVLTLSTEPTSVMRAAYEAVYAGRPLVVSDWPGMDPLFPAAVKVPNTARGLAEGIHRAIDDHPKLVAQAETARHLQCSRWDRQLRDLRASLTPLARRSDSAVERVEPGVGPQWIGGLPVSRPTWEQLEKWAVKQIAAGNGATVCTVAPFQAYLFDTDPRYRGCLARASVVLIDGNGVRLQIAATGTSPGPRMTGRELVHRVFDGQLLPNTQVAVVGGLPETVARLRDVRPTWNLIDDRLPLTPSETDVRAVARRLASRDSDVVLVALGSPKMEIWADALSTLHPAVYISVGGAVDTVAGVRHPPPPLVSALYAEWAWRAAQDPSLVPRLARGVSVMPKFIVRALRERHRGVGAQSSSTH